VRPVCSGLRVGECALSLLHNMLNTVRVPRYSIIYARTVFKKKERREQRIGFNSFSVEVAHSGISSLVLHGEEKRGGKNCGGILQPRSFAACIIHRGWGRGGEDTMYADTYVPLLPLHRFNEMREKEK